MKLKITVPRKQPRACRLSHAAAPGLRHPPPAEVAAGTVTPGLLRRCGLAVLVLLRACWDQLYQHVCPLHPPQTLSVCRLSGGRAQACW